MIEINLIPDVKRELLRAQRMRATVISASIVISFIAAGVVVALLLYIYGVQTVRSAYLDGQIQTSSKKLTDVNDLSKMLTIQNQLTKITQLNSQKNMDSRLFDVLAAVIPPAPNNVQISQVSINATDKTVRLEGQARGYDSLEVFKKTLDSAIINYKQADQDGTDKLANRISMNDTSFGSNANNQKVLRFTLTFAYSDKLFSSDVSNVVVKLNTNGNVTDSYLGVPKSIFTEKAKDL